MIAQNTAPAGDDFLANYTPKNKAEEHFYKAVQLMKAELYQSAVVEFHQACKLNSQEIVPLAKKLYQEKVTTSDYESSLVIGLLLLSLDNGDYLLATELASYARRVDNNNQAISLYKKALKVQPDYMLALCGLGAALEDLPYNEQAAVNAYKYFLDMQYLYPNFLVLDKNQEIDFDSNYLKNIATKAAEFLSDSQSNILHKKSEKTTTGNNDNNPFDITGKADPTKITPNLKVSRNYTASNLNPSDYKHYFEYLAVNESEASDIHNYNIILLLLINNRNMISIGERIELLKEKLKATKKQLPYFEIIEGLYLAQSGSTGEAINHFFGLLKENRFNRYANSNLGLLCRRTNRLQQAARYLVFSYYLYERAHRSFNIETLKKYAKSKFVGRIYKEAQNAFAVLVEEGYATVEEYGYYIECLSRHSKSDQAVKAILQCISLFPDDEEAKIILSEYYNKLVESGDNFASQKSQAGNIKKALDIYRQAFLLDQRIDLIRKMLHIMADADVELTASESEFKDEIKEKLRVMLHTPVQQDNETIKKRKAALNALWANRLTKAKILFKRKQYKEALLLVESAFRLKNNPETYSLLVHLYRLLDRKDELALLTERFHNIKAYEQRLKLTTVKK